MHLPSGLSQQTKANSSRRQTKSKLTISYSIQRIVAARTRSIRWSARQRVCAGDRQGNQVKVLDGTRHCKRFGGNSSGHVWFAVTEHICLEGFVAAAWKPRAPKKARVRRPAEMDALQPRRDHLVKVQCALRWPLGWQVGFMRQKRAAASSRCCRPIFLQGKKNRRKGRSCTWTHRKPPGGTKLCRF